MTTSPCSSASFFKALTPFFKRAGYELYPVLNQFRKYREGGFVNVIFSIAQHQQKLIIECSFGCRINWIEETVMPFSNGINGYKEESNTTVTNLAKYLHKPGYKLHISDAESFKESVAFIQDFFLQQGFSFLEHQTHIKQLEEKFNATPTQNSLYTFNHQLRAFRGISLATIAQNPHWESLRKDYASLLKRYGAPALIMDKYHRLCNHLADISLN
jgi:hypothetical protein